MKKLMAIVLCAAMIVSVLCVNTFANTATNFAANATISVSYVDATKTEPALSETKLNLVNDGDYETKDNASAYWKTENGPIMVTVKLDKMYSVDRIFLATENWYLHGTSPNNYQTLQFEAKVNGEWTAITEKFSDVERAGVESIDQAKNLVPNDIELGDYVVTDEIRLVFHECTRAYFNVKEIMVYGVEYNAENPAIKAAAVIGTTEYATLEEAIAAAQAGDTVTLGKDVTLAATLTINKSVTLDGNGKTITATGFDAVTVTGDGLDVTVKNLTVSTNKNGLLLATAAAKSKFTVADTTVSATGNNAIDAQINWDVDMDRCTFSGKYGFNCSKDNSANTITIDDSILTGTGYGAYFRQGSNVTVSNTKITSTNSHASDNPNSAIQIKTSTADTRATLTLNNCDVTSYGGFVVTTNPYNSVYINGGTYQMTTPANMKSRDAIINVGEAGAYCKITSGTFTGHKNSVARAYGTGAVLEIEGGTFIFNNPTGGGSPIRAGASSKSATINISGGHFITNAKDSVVNYIMMESQINITGGIFENNGEHDIKLATLTYESNVDTSRDVLFPEGVKKLEYKNGAFVNPDAPVEETTTAPADDTTTVPTDDVTTTAPADDTTTAPADDTTTAPADNDDTTTAIPNNNEKPADTDAPAKKGCGGFALAAQLVAILGAAITVVIVKKK